MQVAKKQLATETLRDRESPAPRRKNTKFLLFAWRSFSLRMFLVQRCLMFQHVLAGCDEVRRRKWNLLEEEEAPAKGPKPKKGSGLKADVVDMEMGEPISRSTAGPFLWETHECPHPDSSLKPRAAGPVKWFTCIQCGARWARGSKAGQQRRECPEAPAAAARSFFLIYDII